MKIFGLVGMDFVVVIITETLFIIVIVTIAITGNLSVIGIAVIYLFVDVLDVSRQWKSAAEGVNAER
jgi:hypothetical protein